MQTAVKCVTAGVLAIAGMLSLWAQDGPRGHWSGAVEVPGTPLAMEVDLDKGPNGWVGSVSIPAQNVTGIPLEAIAFTNGKCTFRLKGVPGDPTFSGTLSSDGKTMTGDFTQGPADVPFEFSRTGDPKIEEVKPSPEVSKNFAGTWEGKLEGPGLRLILKISNEAGNSKAVLISPDQGNAEIPISAIEQKESRLSVSAKSIGGKYEAEINKDGSELNGTWTQGGGSLPLKMQKAPRGKTP